MIILQKFRQSEEGRAALLRGHMPGGAAAPPYR